MNKRTRKMILNEIKEIEGVKANAEYVAEIDKIIEQIDKKNANKGATAKQVENEGIKTIIIDTLKALDKAVRISELQDANETLANLSNQKISALLKQLVDEKIVAKTIEKRIAKFQAI